jgi:hypothetical protein
MACVLRKCEKCRRLSERRICHLPCPRGGKQSPRHIVREVRALGRSRCRPVRSRGRSGPALDPRVQKAARESLKKAGSVAGRVMFVALAAKQARGATLGNPRNIPFLNGERRCRASLLRLIAAPRLPRGTRPPRARGPKCRARERIGSAPSAEPPYLGQTLLDRRKAAVFAAAQRLTSIKRAPRSRSGIGCGQHHYGESD